MKSFIEEYGGTVVEGIIALAFIAFIFPEIVDFARFVYDATLTLIG